MEKKRKQEEKRQRRMDRKAAELAEPKAVIDEDALAAEDAVGETEEKTDEA